MKCTQCGREIPEAAIFCCWCGVKQLRERRKKDAIKVPKPRQLRSGAWNIELRAEGQSITDGGAMRGESAGDPRRFYRGEESRAEDDR